MSPEPAPGPSVVLGPSFHPCRLGPVVREVGEYLAGSDASPLAQRHAAAHAFRNAQADFEAFGASICEGTAVTATELVIRGGGRDLLTVATRLPSPLTLLLVCTRNCEDGDLVGIRQRTAKCGALLQEARWPFGMEEAERLTRPASVMFDELQEQGPESVRRRERDAGPTPGRHRTPARAVGAAPAAPPALARRERQGSRAAARSSRVPARAVRRLTRR